MKKRIWCLLVLFLGLSLPLFGQDKKASLIDFKKKGKITVEVSRFVHFDSPFTTSKNIYSVGYFLTDSISMGVGFQLPEFKNSSDSYPFPFGYAYSHTIQTPSSPWLDLFAHYFLLKDYGLYLNFQVFGDLGYHHKDKNYGFAFGPRNPHFFYSQNNYQILPTYGGMIGIGYQISFLEHFLASVSINYALQSSGAAKSHGNLLLTGNDIFWIPSFRINPALSSWGNIEFSLGAYF